MQKAEREVPFDILSIYPPKTSVKMRVYHLAVFTKNTYTMYMKLNFLPLQKSLPKDLFVWLVLLSMGIFVLTSIVSTQIFSLYMVCLLASAFIIFLYPTAGLIAMFILTMWFERFFTLQELVIDVSSYKVYPIDFLLVFIFIAVLVRLYSKEIEWKWHRLDGVIVLFGAVVTGALIMSVMGHTQFSLAFSTYKNYFLYGVVYFFATALLTSKEDWKLFMKWLCIGGIGLLFFLFYGLFTGNGLWSEYTPLSTHGNRLIAGTHVFYFVICAFYLLSHHLWPEKEYHEWSRMNYVLLLLSLIALVVSLVRHLWIAGGILLVLWCVMLSKEKRISLCTMALKLFGALSIFFLIYIWMHGLIVGEMPRWLAEQQYIITERLNVFSLVEMEDSSFAWRIAMWTDAIKLWSQHAVFGIGIGNMFLGFYELTAFEIPVRDLHNNYLGILLQLGLFGISVVAYWFVLVIRYLSMLWKDVAHKGNFYTRMTFTWGSTIVLFFIVFSVSVYWDINVFIIWWWLALAALRFLLVAHHTDE